MKLRGTNFEKLDDWDDWYVSGDGSLDSEAAEKLALTLQTESLRKGLYCVAGVVEDGYGVYLVPQKGIKYVIGSFDVGSHGQDSPESAYDEVREADAKNPLIPYFADEAGIKAKFSKPVSEDLIALLLDSMSSVEAMMEDDDDVEGYIRKNNGIHLWWD